MSLRPMDTKLKTRMAPSLGLLVIAQVLRNEHTVIIEDENISPINYSEKVDVVGITVTVNTLNRASEIAKKYKECGVITVGGGIHISSDPDNCEELFDALCIGPSEQIWNDIINDILNNKLQKRYYCNKSMCSEDIVSPAYDLIDKKKYLYSNVIVTSYGCPFKCSFCYNSCQAYNNIYMNKPVDKVIEEIKLIGRKHIMFIDDNFIGNPQWTRALLKELKKLKVKWNAAVSCNIINMLDLLDEMKDSGCQGLFIGFESLKTDVISNVNKGQNNVLMYEKLIKEIHDRGIMVNASFVFGLDGEDKSVFENTLEWIVKNKIETVTSHILTPYPGTKLYNDFLRDGRITTFDYSKYDTSHVVYSPLNMTQEELYDGYINIYKKIYSIKNIFKRIPSSKPQKIPYLLFNIFYRKYGKFTAFICNIISYERIGRLAEKLSKYV